MGRSRSRSRSRERGGREERGRRDRDRNSRNDRDSRGRDRDGERDRRKRSRTPPRRHFREDGGQTKDAQTDEAGSRGERSGQDTSKAPKTSNQESRRAEAAMKRKKMREEEQRQKEKEREKVKNRLDLIRQMKGDASGEEDALGSGSDDDQGDDAELTEEQQMLKLMGFAGFDSTKGKGVEENKKGPAKGAASKHKQREYRQYMNRRGGFNRPLDQK